jgi:hypothetical protein
MMAGPSQWRKSTAAKVDRRPGWSPLSSQAFASELLLLHTAHWLVIVWFWMLIACSLLHVNSNCY